MRLEMITYTPPEAAELLGISRQAVWDWCKKLGLRQHGRVHVITEADLLKIKNLRGDDSATLRGG